MSYFGAECDVGLKVRDSETQDAGAVRFKLKGKTEQLFIVVVNCLFSPFVSSSITLWFCC